ncbi:MAG: heavy metal translocating P-type ATPase [Chitinophagaceae bacterium]
MPVSSSAIILRCDHCGESCITNKIQSDEKIFCCQGCKMVYAILNEYQLCDYYSLNEKPGINQRVKSRKGKFNFLDDSSIESKLICFKNDEEIHINFYLPQMHCSSCLYLLENIHRLDNAIISSKVNFTRKEIDIVFLLKETSLRKIAELLTSIGYEPYISLENLKRKKSLVSKSSLYQLGIAGFCFGNIMLMSFPEYFGIDASEQFLRNLFRWMNLTLSLPVFFYSALPFYQSSWKSIKNRYLNIDAPIALAIIITFIRSVWEVVSGTGGGYFDSMTGIVFFMLAGRMLQDKTHRSLSFDRTYTSYFPIAVSVVEQEREKPTLLPDIKPGNTLRIHNEELIPTDGILTRGKAYIDYSFVTGESFQVLKEMGELIYAGGKQIGGNIELLVIKDVEQGYLTKLWNRDEFKKGDKPQPNSFVDLISRYFTYVVLAIAIATSIYWQLHDSAKTLTAITSIFIIACPCALLLSSSFTNGNILGILSRNKFYLRNEKSIDAIASATHIVFDKTGTLTTSQQQDICYSGTELTPYQKQQIAAATACSAHPLSKAITQWADSASHLFVSAIKETPGKGIEAVVNSDLIRIGSSSFINGKRTTSNNTIVYISINDKSMGYFQFSNHYRSRIAILFARLRKNYRMSILSGDNDSEKNTLQLLTGIKKEILFNQSPEDKLDYITQLQQQQEKVMMIGDGLNDAGALKLSNIGIALAEDSNNFTPASDAILEAGQLQKLPLFIRLCKANKKIILASFVLSIAYNIAGLYYAVQGNLSPLIAAILMPASSLSILLITFGSSNLLARRMHLQ